MPQIPKVVAETGERCRSNARVDQYNSALRTLAKQKNVRLVDVNQDFKTCDLAALFVTDGLHPNGTGHERIAALIGETLATAVVRQTK